MLSLDSQTYVPLFVIAVHAFLVLSLDSTPTFINANIAHGNPAHMACTACCDATHGFDSILLRMPTIKKINFFIRSEAVLPSVAAGMKLGLFSTLAGSSMLYPDLLEALNVSEKGLDALLKFW